MSTPARPLALSGGACCDGNTPRPQWEIAYRAELGRRQGQKLGFELVQLPTGEFERRMLATPTGPAVREQVIAGYVASGATRALAERLADELWCSECMTYLEGFGGVVPAMLKLWATAASFVPGVGTGLAVALGAAASLAAGNAIEQVLLDSALSAVPAGAVLVPALTVPIAAGKSLLAGEDVGTAALAAGRELARQQGGELAAAAYDGLVVVVQGKSLQDAGFASLRSLAKGNDLAERATSFTEKAAKAARDGRELQDVLVSDLRDEIMNVAGAAASDKVQAALTALERDPRLAALGSISLGKTLGIAEPLARAAQAVMQGGTPDPELLRWLTLPVVASLNPNVAKLTEPYDVCAFAASATARGSVAAAGLQAQCDARRRAGLSIVIDPRALSPAPLPPAYAVYVASSDTGLLPSSSSATAAAQPFSKSRSSRSTIASDVALGGTIAAAGLALYWWSSAKA